MPTKRVMTKSTAINLSVLVAQVKVSGAACLLVTHSDAAAQRADRVLRLTVRGVVTPAADLHPAA